MGWGRSPRGCGLLSDTPQAPSRTVDLCAGAWLQLLRSAEELPGANPHPSCIQVAEQIPWDPLALMEASTLEGSAGGTPAPGEG